MTNQTAREAALNLANEVDVFEKPDLTAMHRSELEAEVVHQAKLIERFRQSITNIVREVEDEGDRAYFGSTNDLEDLRDLDQSLEDCGNELFMPWVMGDDLYADLRKLRSKVAKYDRVLRAFVEWSQRVDKDEECEYLNGKGWDDFDALVSSAMGLLASSVLSQQPPASEVDESFLIARVSQDGTVVGIDHPTDTDWGKVRRAHVALRDRINERLAKQDNCPFKPASEVEALEGYRAAIMWVASDSWDGCSDCIEMLRRALSVDNFHWSPDDLAAALKRLNERAGRAALRTHPDTALRAENEALVEALELNSVHIRLLERGEKYKWIGLSDNAGIRVGELVALGELNRAGYACETAEELPPGPPMMKPSEITDEGLKALAAHRERQ